MRLDMTITEKATDMRHDVPRYRLADAAFVAVRKPDTGLFDGFRGAVTKRELQPAEHHGMIDYGAMLFQLEGLLGGEHQIPIRQYDCYVHGHPRNGDLCLPIAITFVRPLWPATAVAVDPGDPLAALMGDVKA